MNNLFTNVPAHLSEELTEVLVAEQADPLWSKSHCSPLYTLPTTTSLTPARSIRLEASTSEVSYPRCQSPASHRRERKRLR